MSFAHSGLGLCLLGATAMGTLPGASRRTVLWAALLSVPDTSKHHLALVMRMLSVCRCVCVCGGSLLGHLSLAVVIPFFWEAQG